MHRYALIKVGCIECSIRAHSNPQLLGTYQTEDEAQAAYNAVPHIASDADTFVLDMVTGKNLTYTPDEGE